MYFSVLLLLVALADAQRKCLLRPSITTTSTCSSSAAHQTSKAVAAALSPPIPNQSTPPPPQYQYSTSPGTSAIGAPPCAPVSISRTPTTLSPYQRAVAGTAAIKARINQTLNKTPVILGSLSQIAPQITGAINLTNQDNNFFNAPITVAGKTFNLYVDTGSADIWVRGSKCATKDVPNSCVGQNLSINSTNVTSIFSLKTGFKAVYGTGSAIGVAVKADVAFGALQTSVWVGASVQQTGFETNSDGMLGLGFNNQSTIASLTNQSSNFMDNLAAENTSRKNSVAFYFNTNVTGVGEMVFGETDASKYTGDWTNIPLNSESKWQIDFRSVTFSINGTEREVAGGMAGNFSNALVDTGTSLILIDLVPAMKINNAIGATKYDPKTGFATFPDCSKAYSGPTVYISMGGTKFAIPPNVYVTPNTGDCYSAFGVLTGVDPKRFPALLGDPWMKAVYTNFDKDNMRLQMAKSINVK